MKTKNIYISLMALFLLAAMIFGGIWFYQSRDAVASEEAFNKLENLIVQPADTPTEPETDEPATDDEEIPEESTEPVEDEIAEALAAQAQYQALYEQNDEFVGWIKIDNTMISYPVMQSIDNPDFYLKHAFDKSYSNYGVPYIDEACATGLSNNMVIYGHNMKNGSMFSDLVKYTSQDYYESHPIIQYDTLTQLSKYQIVCVFRFDTNNETFRFNEYTDMNEEEFAEYMANCHERQLYDTGITAEYGDELITLSTCEYTYENGRFIVVAKKIVE